MIEKFKSGSKKTVQKLNSTIDKANRLDAKKTKQLTRPAINKKGKIGRAHV